MTGVATKLKKLRQCRLVPNAISLRTNNCSLASFPLSNIHDCSYYLSQRQQYSSPHFTTYGKSTKFSMLTITFYKSALDVIGKCK